MDQVDALLKSVVIELAKIGSIKSGNFVLKSGLRSPIYVDMRILLGYPLLLKKLSELVWLSMEKLSLDLLCGVPYGAIPLATTLSIFHNKPLCIRRKGRKEGYGTGKLIEGVYQKGDCVVVIEDVVSTGQSILETVRDLREAGLVVRDIVCFIDREMGSQERLAENGLCLHSSLSLKRLLILLEKEGLLSPEALEYQRSNAL